MPDSVSESFSSRHGLAILFLCVALCLAGAYAALGMPSSIFPQTDFPRVVIMVDNGVMPADEMMAAIMKCEMRHRSTLANEHQAFTECFGWKVFCSAL